MIHQYEAVYSRDPGSVALLGATKGQSVEKMREAIEAGHYIFGENYVQEALIKQEALNDKNIQWHFIGAIQSNKAKKIAEHFDWVQSIDSLKVLESLSAHRPDNLPPLNICLEINISNEPTKAGLLPNEILPLAEKCLEFKKLNLRGLMAIPAPKLDFDHQRQQFKKIRQLFDGLVEKGFKLDTLSMGMSNDMEAAIAEGATMVRIGTNLFGPRQ